MSGAVPLRCACGTDFFHLASLCHHVSENTECLVFWGSSIDNLKKKVKSVRNAWNHNKAKESRNEKRALEYQKKKNERDMISFDALKEFERAGR